MLAIVGLVGTPIVAVAALSHTMNTNPRWVQLRAGLQNDQASDERHELRLLYRREALEADEQMRKTYNQALRDALELNFPERRDPEKAREAIAALVKAQAKLNEAIDRIAAIPAMKDAEVERERQQTLEYLRSLAQLGATAESFLREDRNLLNENKKALDAQEAKVTELQPEWVPFKR
jgi:hypothetical protein